jgi:DNA-binding response OmpR family regulator
MTKILIIEDEVVLADAYKFVLKKSGYDVYVAYRAPEGLELAKQHNPHLIILDMLMPDMNGIEFLQALQPKKLPHTKVCVLSNIENPEIMSAAKKLGADDYLLKVNYTPYQMTEVIETMLKK